MTLYQVKALRRVRTREGLIIQKKETRSFDCDTIEQAREYFTKPDLTLLSPVEEAKS